MPAIWTPSRRLFLGQAAFGAVAFTTPGLFAEMLTRTPFQTEGPFYPDKLPLDTDNDLLVINDALTPAVGEVTHLHGKVTDVSGNPIRNALVEIWQVNAHGAYIHTQSANQSDQPANFQGFGRFLTGRKGEYYFRTIKPVTYPGRTPHIHFKVKRKGKPEFTSQCYINGHPQNERDGVLRRYSDDKKLWNAVMVDFKPLRDSPAGELDAEFNIVLGVTPADDDQTAEQREGDRGIRGGRRRQ